MSKNVIIKQIRYLYVLEKTHTFITFPCLIIYLIFISPLVELVFPLYGFVVGVFILFQGQKFWKIKLYKINGKTFDNYSNLIFFRKSKKMNLLLIGLMPLVFIIHYYFNKSENNKLSALLSGMVSNIFAVLEYINYYHKQLMINNTSDFSYLRINKKFKKSALAKALQNNSF
jgi:hypothetical protein